MGSTAQDLSSNHRGKRHHEHKSRVPVDWNLVNPQTLHDAIRYVAKSGGAIRLGLTRDNGAYSIGIYGEGDPYTEYFNDVSSLHEFLLELIRDYGEGDTITEKYGL